jgi:hypothetical protein
MEMFNFDLKGAKEAVKIETVKRLTEKKMEIHAAFVAAQIDGLTDDYKTISLVVTTRPASDDDEKAGKRTFNMQVRIQRLDLLQ